MKKTNKGVESEETEKILDSDQKLFEKIELMFQRELCLTKFSSHIAIHYLQSRISRENGPMEFKRVMGYLFQILNNNKQNHCDVIDSSIDGSNLWQSGCPNVIRGLRASPFWNTNEFPWIKNLEAAGPDICLGINTIV